MVKNKDVFAIILGVTIFASTGLSGSYAYSESIQGQDQQQANSGYYSSTHGGNHHRGLQQGIMGYNMTAFNHGNYQRAFSHNMTNYITPLVNNSTIPSWVKSTTKYWSQGQVNDTDFVGGLQYMIKSGIINVPPTQVSQGNSHQIPKWVKNDANLWATGQMTEKEFIQSIQYLISTGIIRPGS